MTHNLPLAFEVSDRIVVLNRGQKVADVAVQDTDNDAVVGWITGARQPSRTSSSARRAATPTAAPPRPSQAAATPAVTEAGPGQQAGAAPGASASSRRYLPAMLLNHLLTARGHFRK